MTDQPATNVLPKSGAFFGPKLPRSPVIAVWWLLVRNLLTKGKLVLFAVSSTVSVLVAFAVADQALPEDQDRLVVEFVYALGLTILLPILTLVMASAVFGDLVSDETLVYLWLRPVRRITLTIGAWTAALVVVYPVTVTPLVAAAWIGSEGNIDIVKGTAAAASLNVLVYSAMFTLLGLLLKRSLLFGLMYIFIWELFVASVGDGAATLSIGTYPAVVLARMTGEMPFEIASLEQRSMTVAVIVPIAVAAVSLLLTNWRLAKTRVA